MTKNIAIIPARAGSKRIPNKNIRDFHGKPIIGWAIETAIESGCFDKIVVSTDSSEIARISADFGASVPFLRPSSLADDHTPVRAVVADAIRRLEKDGKDIYENICCILPTSPLMMKNDLVSGFKQLTVSGFDYVFSAAQFCYPVQRGFLVGDSGRLTMLFPEHLQSRSQDLSKIFHDAGQFYWGRKRVFLQNIALDNCKTDIVLIPKERVCDIDDELDWQFAYKLFNLQSGKHV